MLCTVDAAGPVSWGDVVGPHGRWRRNAAHLPTQAKHAAQRSMETEMGLAAGSLTNEEMNCTGVGVAVDLGCDWHTVVDSVMVFGAPLLEDPAPTG